MPSAKAVSNDVAILLHDVMFQMYWMLVFSYLDINASLHEICNAQPASYCQCYERNPTFDQIHTLLCHSCQLRKWAALYRFKT